MGNFALRLKELRLKNNILQKDLSKDLGVAQTTISNYEKGIRFPDEDILRNIASYFNVTLDCLFGYGPENDLCLNKINEQIIDMNVPNDLIELTPLAKQYMKYLIDGEKSKAWILLVDAIKKGEDVKNIYINVFERTLNEVGLLWETNKIDISQEHYFSEATQEIMSQIKPLKPRQANKAHTFLSFSIGGELHNIGIKMVTEFMEMDGWNTCFLGTNLPSQSLIRAIEYYKPDIIAISSTMSYNINQVSSLIDTVHSAHLIKMPKIIVGGSTFDYDKTLWKKVNADGYTRNATDCVKLANLMIQKITR